MTVAKEPTGWGEEEAGPRWLTDNFRGVPPASRTLLWDYEGGGKACLHPQPIAGRSGNPRDGIRGVVSP